MFEPRSRDAFSHRAGPFPEPLYAAINTAADQNHSCQQKDRTGEVVAKHEPASNGFVAFFTRLRFTMAAQVGHTPDGEEERIRSPASGANGWNRQGRAQCQASIDSLDPYAFTVLCGSRRCGDALPAAGGSRN